MSATWLHIVPLAGEGNGQLQVVIDDHTGRLSRSTSAIVATEINGPDDVPIERQLDVTQDAHKEFIDGKTEYLNIAAAATSFNITGVSNSKVLDFAVSGCVTSLDNLVVNSNDVIFGTDIENDPGALAQYEFSAIAHLSANTTIEERTGTITITCEKTTVKLLINVKQLNAAAYIKVSVAKINLGENGAGISGDSDDTFNIESNSPWIIE